MLIVYLTVLVCLRQGIDTFVKLISPVLKKISVASSTLQAKYKLENELNSLIAQQEQINMMDEFAKYAKLQRKILPLKEELKVMANDITQKHLMVQTFFQWIFHSIFSVLLLYQIYMHKYEPVLVVPPELVNPNVLAKIVAFPTGIPGNVGCVFWLIICKLTIGSLSKYLVR